MARLVVQYPGDVGVVVDGTEAGRTNRALAVGPGRHVVRLAGDPTEPDERTIDVEPEAPADRVLEVGFAPAAPAVDRFSPLVCRYDGFLLGQFLALAFAEVGRVRYTERRVRLLAFLRELDIDLPLPAAPQPTGGPGHAALLTRVLPLVAGRSRELAEFALLGGLLTQYGLLAQHDHDVAASILQEAERIRAAYRLPPIDPARFHVPAGVDDPDRVLAPGLGYLRDVLAGLPIEDDTAFVSIPAAPAYDAAGRAFARPTLDLCGYRACRAWSGLESQAHAEVVLALIGRSALIWADVSEPTFQAAYEIGAAHAQGKLGILVARADRSGSDVPAVIGRDAVIRYDPADADWPTGAVLLMAASVAALKLAADRGERIHISPGAIAGVFDEVSQTLRHVLLPAGALEDDETRVWRGWARLGVGRLDEAAADFDAVLEGDSGAGPGSDWRPVAAYMRGLLREARDDFAGALADYDLALALGVTDPDAHARRAALAARLGAEG